MENAICTSETEKPISPTVDELEHWLREEDLDRLASLYRHANALRARVVGNEVHLRGLLEISNHCRRHCRYCGINATRRELRRYRMSPDEIVACAQQAARYGYGTVVMQSGEDPGITADRMANIIRRIKETTPLAVTLSLGERSPEDLLCWRAAGADRYLLRFETSDRALYERIHPPPATGETFGRFALLKVLRQLGYEVGSGVMAGLPGQSCRSLAHDITCFRELDLDMVGVGPYIPHPETPLGRNRPDPLMKEAARNTQLVTCKVLALTRLACPEANLPATTALATLDRRQGYRHGLTCGANVIMPNITPVRYRKLYEIYPSKICMSETPEASRQHALSLLTKLQRSAGQGRGDRIRRGETRTMDTSAHAARAVSAS